MPISFVGVSSCGQKNRKRNRIKFSLLIHTDRTHHLETNINRVCSTPPFHPTRPLFGFSQIRCQSLRRIFAAPLSLTACFFQSTTKVLTFFSFFSLRSVVNNTTNKMLRLLTFTTLVVSTASTQAYTSAKVGEWVPPSPPLADTLHLKHLNLKQGDKLPAPTMVS